MAAKNHTKADDDIVAAEPKDAEQSPAVERRRGSRKSANTKIRSVEPGAQRRVHPGARIPV
jgi:hypothetical protein